MSDQQLQPEDVFFNSSRTDRQTFSSSNTDRGAVEEEEELLVVHRGHAGGIHRGSVADSSNSVEFNSRASSLTTDSFCERSGGAESEESLQERLR